MKFKNSLYIVFSVILITACQKEEITIGQNVSETFFVTNKKSTMRVLVEGNTESKVMLLHIHGGPGASAYLFDTDHISDNLEDKYGVVYWDQRNSGGSQGSFNLNNITLENNTEDLKKVIQVLKHRYGQDTKIFLLAHSYGGLLSTSFLTTDDNEDLVQGWINIAGCNDYSTTDFFGNDYMIKIADEQIALERNVSEWVDIKQTVENSTLEFYGLPFEYRVQTKKALGLVGLKSDNKYAFDIFLKNVIQKNIPITTVAVGVALGNNSYNLSLRKNKISFDSKLNKITIPTRFLYGQFDFNCTVNSAEDMITKLGTPDDDKDIITIPNGGHFLWETNKDEFTDHVIDFVERYK